MLSKLARARGGVRPHRGITVIPTCGAAPAPVMPQVRRTWGRAESREKPQVPPLPGLPRVTDVSIHSRNQDPWGIEVFRPINAQGPGPRPPDKHRTI